MNSHEYAVAIRKQAEYLESKPQFEIPSYVKETETFWYMHDKEGFVSAVRAVGAGRKEIGIEYVDFYPTNAPIRIKIERNSICKLVRAAEYDCEPFLSHEELDSLDTPKPMQEAVESDIPY